MGGLLYELCFMRQWDAMISEMSDLDEEDMEEMLTSQGTCGFAAIHWCLDNNAPLAFLQSLIDTIKATLDDATLKEILSIRDDFGNTALHMVSRSPATFQVLMLILDNSHPNDIVSTNNNGQTPLDLVKANTTDTEEDRAIKVGVLQKAEAGRSEGDAEEDEESDEETNRATTLTYNHYRGAPGLSPSSLSPEVAFILDGVAFLESQAFPTLAHQSSGQWLVNLQSPKSVVFVARSSAAVVAYCHATFSAGTCAIRGLATIPAYQVFGVGTRLLTTALAWGRKMEKSYFATLNVSVEADDAIRLYEKLGFEMESTLPEFYSDGGDAYRYFLEDVKDPRFVWDGMLGENSVEISSSM
jgi:ribosomal protein S18 acetylase RimI-like enzyme